MPAINNYGTLKAALSTYLFHQRFIGSYDIATGNFEASINRRLSVRPMETGATLTTTNGQCPLPPNYMTWRYVEYQAAGKPYPQLDYIHPAYFGTTHLTTESPVQVFSIEGSTFLTDPIDDSPNAFYMGYFRTIPSVVGPNDNTNWLLLEHPDTYLFGVLVELSALGRNIEMATLYKQRRDEALQEVINEYADGVGATSPLVRQAEYF